MNSATGAAAAFVDKLNQVILFPTIALLSSIALLVFLYGCFVYIVNSNNQQARGEGVRHILWGVVGLVVMLSAYSILSIVVATFGLDDELNCANDPSASGCDGSVFDLPVSGGTENGGLTPGQEQGGLGEQTETGGL